jgi:hypothetical protein
VALSDFSGGIEVSEEPGEISSMSDLGELRSSESEAVERERFLSWSLHICSESTHAIAGFIRRVVPQVLLRVPQPSIPRGDTTRRNSHKDSRDY